MAGGPLDDTSDPDVASAPTAVAETLPPSDVPPSGPRAPSPFDATAEPFTLGQVLGRGGMGQVMLAEDRRLGRQVAVKELLSQSGNARARFEREVRLAARLQHPNIVPIYEAGRTARGEPYYAMRPVSGQTLGRAIERAGTRAERLALVPRVIAVAEALAFAHQNGVIHRDLKPSNVLIGEFGETVVIDWGLAKQLGEASIGGGGGTSDEAGSSDVTRHGSVVGTPAYMAPEQARGETLDARADVYAIGAILYHVLAGVAPYHGAGSVDELLERVRRGPPEALGRLEPELPADLVAVVDRAMRRERADRYADARGLAEDLTRFAAGRLVSTHAYSLRQLLGRWIRRHRLALAVGTAAAVLLAAGGVYAVLAIRGQRTTAVRAQKVAEERRVDVEGLLDFMLGDLHKELSSSGDLEALTASTERIADYFARHPPEPGDRVAIRRRAALQFQLATVAEAGGDPARADQLLDTALTLVSSVAGPDDAEATLLLQTVLEARANVTLDLGRIPDALALIERALAQAQAAAAGGDVLWRHRVAGALFLRARARIAQSDPEAAKRDLEDALARYRAIVAEVPGNRVVERDVGRVLGRLATMAGDVREHQRALELSQEAALVFERLVEAEPGQVIPRTDLLQTLSALARHQAYAGDRAASRRTLERTQVLAERLIIDDPGRPEHTQQLALTLTELAGHARADRDFTGALALGHRAIDLIEHLTKVDPSRVLWRKNLAEAHDQLAATLRESGDLRGSLAAYEPANAIRRALIKEAPAAVEHVLDLALDLDKASMLHRDLGAHALAATTASEAAELRAPVLAARPDNREAHFQQGISLMRVGTERFDSGDLAGAVTAYDRAQAVLDGFLARQGKPDAGLEKLRGLIIDLRSAARSGKIE